MKIKEKIYLDRQGLEEHGPITIVALGDSVTHGAVAFGEINYETVYWNVLRKKILEVRNYMPVNVINAGIGGINAKESIKRLDKQVICHNPDLVIVCFGLNDVNGTLEEYISSLTEIFERCKNCGADVIFMTPNMLNTYVSDDTKEDYKNYAARTASFQNDGKMDTFMEEAKKLALSMDVTVCDCYSKWKELSKTEDTTMLLANRINHPKKEMHTLFADMLFDVIFDDVKNEDVKEGNTMYKE